MEAALAAGAVYADARVEHRHDQRLDARDGRIETIAEDERAGVGVRALLGSSWGFASTSELDDAALRAVGARAAAIARASGRVAGAPLGLADVPVVSGSYETPVVEHPFTVPVDEKVDLLVTATTTMRQAVPGVIARGHLAFRDARTWFVSSVGHRQDQHLVEAGGGISATVVGERETQRRSYPQDHGDHGTGGYELVRRDDLAGNAARVAEEARQLLTADPCPEGTMDLVLGGSQLALQIHESVGHATELDRILGWEAAFAGTSFLDLDRLGSFRYGSELMTITADATIPGAVATFGFDHEGTPAQRVDLVRDGTWVGVLSGRDSAARAGVPAGGMVRADGFNRLPMVRMTNVGLVPGDDTLAAIVADTRRGVLMDTNRSWSIDDRRLNFQFGCEIGWEIVDGRLGRMVRNPTYTGITPRFWASMDRLAGGDEWRAWGLLNCGKGQPMQVGHTAHPAAPARFRDVRVGVRG